MDAQVAGGTGKEDMAQLLALALEERLHLVPLQDGIDAGVVKFGYIDVGLFSGSLATHELRQHTRRRMGEHVAINHVVASLVALDNHPGHHE